MEEGAQIPPAPAQDYYTYPEEGYQAEVIEPQANQVQQSADERQYSLQVSPVFQCSYVEAIIG